MRVMGRPVGILDRGAGVAPWETILDDYDFSAGGDWGGAADFTITEVESIFPGESGWQHENGGSLNSRSRSQQVGTLTGEPETFSVVWSNVDAATMALGIRDLTASSWMVLGEFNPSTGIIASAGFPEIGSDLSYSAVQREDGAWILTVTGTPPSVGNIRRLNTYVTGLSQNTDTAILYRARHQVRSNWI